jgi:hypothetical protein
MNNFFSRFFQRSAKAVTSVAASLSTPVENDQTFFGNNASAFYADRYSYDRAKVLAECLRAWRVNPIARNIVRVISAFVVGKGMDISSPHKASDKFLKDWWTHRLNRIDRQLRDWQDEMTRTGNLFFLFSVDEAGMSYVRAVPAELIEEIEHTKNDVMQETSFKPKDLNAAAWPVYDPMAEQTSFMLHYASNKPVGASWGEPDLAPMLPWIGRLSSMLEDRVRLNRFRNAFMYIVQGNFATPADKAARQRELNATPPTPGSILVTDPSEQWGIINATLDSFDAQMDIQEVKKFIAAGVNFPLHWLAEPETSGRSTAEAAGTPTFRTLEQTQDAFVFMLSDMAKIALSIRKRVDARVNVDAEIELNYPDITERDNGSLALAANRIWPVAIDLFDRKMIDAEEVVYLIYRMMAEPYEPVEEALKAIRVDPRAKGAGQPTSPATPDPKTDPTIPTEATNP